MTKDCLLLIVNTIGLNTVYSDYYMEYGLHTTLYTPDYYTEYGLHTILYTQTITQNMDYIQYCILRLLHRIWTTCNTVYSDYYTEYGLHTILYTQTITQNMDYMQYCIPRLLHGIWTTFNCILRLLHRIWTTLNTSYSKKNPRCTPHN